MIVLVISREIRLKKRPVGMPTNDNFELVEAQVPDPSQGEFLVRNIWMSVDPYMRARIASSKRDNKNMRYYAEGVRKFEKQLGLPVKSFPDLGLYEIDNDSNDAYDDTDDARTELSELL